MPYNKSVPLCVCVCLSLILFLWRTLTNRGTKTGRPRCNQGLPTPRALYLSSTRGTGFSRSWEASQRIWVTSSKRRESSRMHHSLGPKLNSTPPQLCGHLCRRCSWYVAPTSPRSLDFSTALVDRATRVATPHSKHGVYTLLTQGFPQDSDTQLPWAGAGG